MLAGFASGFSSVLIAISAKLIFTRSFLPNTAGRIFSTSAGLIESLYAFGVVNCSSPAVSTISESSTASAVKFWPDSRNALDSRILQLPPPPVTGAATAGGGSGAAATGFGGAGGDDIGLGAGAGFGAAIWEGAGARNGAGAGDVTEADGFGALNGFGGAGGGAATGLALPPVSRLANAASTSTSRLACTSLSKPISSCNRGCSENCR